MSCKWLTVEKLSILLFVQQVLDDIINDLTWISAYKLQTIVAIKQI